MATISLKVRNQEVEQAITALLGSINLAGGLTPAMQAVAALLKAGTDLRFKEQRAPDGTPWRPTHRGGTILRLTSRLRNSITPRSDASSAGVGTNLIYAPIHQFGGTIRASKGKYLAIPIGPAAIAASRAGGGPRQFPGPLHYIVSHAGNKLLMGDDGPQYVLKESVTMPARPFLGLSDDDSKGVIDILSAHIAKSWQPK